MINDWCLSSKNPVQALFGVNNEVVELKAKDCQVIAACLVILKLSFWATGSFKERLDHCFGQFKKEGYAQKLKECIHSLPGRDLVEFLYNKILSF